MPSRVARLLTILSFANSSASLAIDSLQNRPGSCVLNLLGVRALAVSLLILSVALPSVATTYAVTNTNDGGPGSLRAALSMAGDGDLINFSLTYPATITLTSGYLEISKNLTISGPGPASLAISGNKIYTVFQVDSSVTATIYGLTIEKGSDGGGGIFNNGGMLTVSNSTLMNNSGVNGGGIFNNGGSLALSNSTLSGNTTPIEGGGINNNNATLTITDSALSGNFTTVQGGAIFNNSGTVTVTNSTFSGNSSGNVAGAIFNNLGTLTISFSTFSGNSAPNGGGSISDNQTTMTTMKSTLLAGQTSGGNCYSFRSSEVSEGYNLSDDDSCTFLTQTTDQNDVTTARLSPSGLQNNGGPTETIALLPTSSAVDAIPVPVAHNHIYFIYYGAIAAIREVLASSISGPSLMHHG
jgi:hypothetical protein